MRALLNTVYITTQGAWLHKDGANLVMEVERSERARLPAHMLSGLVCFGQVSVSSALMAFCAEQGITITHLTEHGRFLARVEGPVSGNVLLRRAQYRATDDPVRCVAVVQNLLAGKLNNQRAVLSRALRDHADKWDGGDLDRLRHAQQRLGRLAQEVLTLTDLDLLRGKEGEAAQLYFGCFQSLILNRSGVFRFDGRSRRPPRDAVNALMSFFYTLVTHDCRSALEAVGLDPAAGFLHRDRPGRPSLALDLLEEFRPVIADRLVLTLINRQQLNEGDFDTLETGAVVLREDARKAVLVAYQERKREELMHPFIGEKAALGLFPLLQAQLLARHLRGDIDGYPPFIWK